MSKALSKRRPRHGPWACGIAGALVTAVSSLALAQAHPMNAAPGVPAASASHPSSLACPIDLAAAGRFKASTVTVSVDRTCLIDVRNLRSDANTIYDVRDRGEFLQFHLPGASNATVAALVTMPIVSSSEKFVVYDGGKFSSDAFALCSRLRKAGLRNVRVLDGGIAAWTQWQDRPEKLLVSRLSDQEIAAALLEPDGAVLGLTPSLQQAIRDNHLDRRRLGDSAASMTVILAEESTPSSKLEALLDGSHRRGKTLYWLGSKDRLAVLLRTFIAQDSKRLAGPAEASHCSAL